MMTAILAFTTIFTTLASDIYAPTVSSIATNYHVVPEVATLGVALHVLVLSAGYASSLEYYACFKWQAPLPFMNVSSNSIVTDQYYGGHFQKSRRIDYLFSLPPLVLPFSTSLCPFPRIFKASLSAFFCRHFWNKPTCSARRCFCRHV